MDSKFEFRELCAKDMFPMFALLNKIGVKELKDYIGDIDIKDNNFETVGMNIMFAIGGLLLEHLPNCENEIFTMLSNVSGMDKNSIANLSMADFAEMVIEFVKKPEFMDFFKVVSKLFKSEM